MSDTLITVVAIVVAATLIFFVPLMTTADKFNDVSKAEVESIVTDFVNEIRTTGKITQEDYNKFKENLAATGYTFGVDMEVKKMDEKPGKKTLQTAKDKIGENVYYSEYTTQIEKELEDNGVYSLSKGDIVKVDVRNTSKTFSQQLKQFAYKITGNDEATIVATAGGTIQ